MSAFAKLFEFPDLGQVLVKIDTGEDGVEVRLYFMPKNLGVCSVALSRFPGDEDEQWDHAQARFDGIDQESAHEIVSETLKTIPEGLK